VCVCHISLDGEGNALYPVLTSICVVIVLLQQNTEKQLEDLKELQGKLKTMSAEARDKDLLYNQLVSIFRRMWCKGR